MGWKELSAPIKALVIYSILAALLLIASLVFLIMAILIGEAFGIGFALIGVIFLAAVLAGPWLFVAIFRFLLKRKMKTLAKVISILGIIGSLIWFILVLYDFIRSGISQIFHLIPMGYVILIIIMVIFFIVSLIEIGKQKTS